VFEIREFVAVGVAVAVGEIVRGRIWIQTLDRFPPIGQAVVVGVVVRGALHEWIIFPAAHVVLRVGQTRRAAVRAGAGVGVGAVERLANYAHIVVVNLRLRAAHVGEHELVGVGGGLNRRVGWEKRRADPRAVIGGQPTTAF